MDTNRPVSGFFHQDVYKELLQAMLMDDENKFNQILTAENVNVNKVYDKGVEYGTLLDFCCVERNKSKYIATLLNRGANPNLINSRTKKGPIHQIAMHEDNESMRVLLSFSETDPNLLDNFGSTALHYACKNNDIETVQEIIKNVDVNINITNRKGKSPLQLILDKEPSSEYLGVLKTLLSQPYVDVSLTDSEGTTLQQLLEEAYPELANGLPVLKNGIQPNLDVSHLFQLLRRNQYNEFLTSVKGNREVFEGNDGSYTFLQYSCEYGLDLIAQALLDVGVNPNGTCTANIWPPLMIACRKGFVSIVKMFVHCSKTSFEPVDNETVLHGLVNCAHNKQALGESNIERNHLKCLQYLLNKVPREKLDINFCDRNGNTALHYAAKLADENLVLEILNAGAYIGVCNKLNEPACADISRAMMERHLDNCVYTNDKVPRDEMFAFVFNYSCLIPFHRTVNRGLSTSTENFIEVPISTNDNEEPHFQNQGETDPLIYMSKNSELRPLLTHPIFTSYLHMKWHKIQPYYFINLMFYFIFWLVLTYYLLFVFIEQSPCNPVSNSTVDGLAAGTKNSNYVVWSLVLLSLFLFILREILQLLISPLKYIFNPENWLEISIIGITFFILFCDSCSSIKHQLSAIGILLTWAELVLLIGKHPSLSINIEMLKTVSWNFLKFLAWYSILIVAFALCFYTLFKDAAEDDNQFQHPGVAIFKTVVMLTGEFDSGAIPFLLYPVTSHILFVLFVFLIAIVLFNLLNGLAVSDTQAIKADAELVGYISQAKLISHIEEKLLNHFNCWGLFPVSFNFSNKINLFQDISDGTIRVYPNCGNKVELDDLNFVQKRNPGDGESSCCEFKSIFMDSRIIKSARDITIKRELVRSQESYQSLFIEKEFELRELLKDFRQCLQEYKEVSSRMSLK